MMLTTYLRVIVEHVGNPHQHQETVIKVVQMRIYGSLAFDPQAGRDWFQGGRSQVYFLVL